MLVKAADTSRFEPYMAPLIRGVVFCFALVVQLFFLLPVSPDKIVASDFPSFYSAARIWQAGRNPYSLAEQCTAQATFVPAELPCLPFAHPPILLPLVSALSSDNFHNSYWRILVVLALVSVASFAPLYLLSKSVGFSLESLIFIPVMIGALMGQDTAFVLFGVVSWAYLSLTSRDLSAGVALSLAVLKPHIAIIFALPLVFSRPRIFLGFCWGAFALTLFSFLLVGPAGFRGLIEITQVMGRGEGFGISQSKMPNATGLLVMIGVKPLWTWAIFILGVVAISFLWRRKGVTHSTLGIAVIVALFAAPHAHIHDLSLLLIPLWPLSKTRPWAPIAASLILTVGMALTVLPFVSYGVMLALLAFHMHGQQEFAKVAAK